ncbi:MAG: mandelate racemase/muconate lactonizing enzyme family protein [Candidatus Hodarchaeota archaeon]
MHRIQSVDTDIIKTQLADKEFTTTYGQEPKIRHHVIVRISTESGECGLGEACPLPFTPDDDPNRIKHIIDIEFAPILIGSNPFDLDFLHSRMENVPVLGNTARAGVDIALHDLIGKILDLPLYRHLGGSYQKHVEIAEVLGIGTPSVIAKRAKESANRGARAIKIKVGMDLDRDVDVLKRVRAEVGDSTRIRADANSGYSLKEAKKVLDETEEIKLEYMEQPLPADDLEGLRNLRESISTPIMVDESIHTVEDARVIIQHEAADFFGLKFIKHGGIHITKKIADLAAENHIECVLISPWETQIGIAAAVHLALSASNFTHPHEISPRSLMNDPVHGLKEVQGRIRVPEGAGLGVSL